MRRITLLLAFGLLTLPSSLQAADTWTTPHPGMRHLYRTASGPLRMHALVVNLCNPGVSIRATKSGERQHTVSSFAGSVGAEAAINGDFFSYGSYQTVGLSVGNGEKWGDTADGAGEGFFAFGPSKAYLSFPQEVVSNLPTWMKQVVSGRPTIVQDGAAIHTYDCSDHYCQRHPRTAVGISKNRRTLYMLVVDGRTTNSIGVTLSQLADIMVDIGAYDALNFDGGGSTDMWIKGTGVVNVPSDGAERVVANHLAVQADGSGMPGSCAEDPLDELLVNAHLMDASENTDIDGDGKADACARAAAGYRCSPSSGTGFGAAIAINDLTDDGGWDDPSNYGTIRMGDITGDGKADVCARGNAGLRCWPSTGTAFGDGITGPAFSDASGYSDIKYYSTLRLADITGDGKDDVCIRDNDGISCYPSTGTGFGAGIAGPDLSDASGWGAYDHYGTIRTGDINGDGKADICARAGAGMWCWPSTGTGFGPQITGPTWSDANGWSEPRYFSTIQLADINGDGKDDLCGRGAAAFVCHISTGTGFGPQITGPALSDTGGWDDQTNYLTFRMADITGDGKADLCARANAGMLCWPSTGTGFGAQITGPALSDDDGWFQEKYFRTIRLGDVNGDGKADICARSSTHFSCWPSTGTGFGAKVDGPQWADSVGWGSKQYYSTVRLATYHPLPEPGPDAGVDATADQQAPEDSAIGPDSTLEDSAIEPDSAQEDSQVPSDAAQGHDSGTDKDAGEDAAEEDSGSNPDLPGASNAEDSSGCGCAVPGANPGKAGLGALLIGLGWMLIGRRRRRAGC